VDGFGVTSVRWDEILLHANQTYRLVVKPTSASNGVKPFGLVCADATALQYAVPEGSRWQLTERTDAGAWTDTSAEILMMALIISDITLPYEEQEIDPMARLALTVQTPPGKYPALPLTANSADLAWTASGANYADGASFTLTGRELLLVRNANAGAQTITISSVADDKGRVGDITTYSIGIGEYAMFGPFPREGWAQSDGKLYFAVTAADLYFAVVQLPALN
jgi:hypothetical protein